MGQLIYMGDRPSSSLRRRLNLIWVFIFLAAGFFSFGLEKIIPKGESPVFIEVLDLQWLSFKQAVQRNYLMGKLRPSDRILLLELNYSNRADFWFDDSTRAILAKKLASYSGPIVSNIDPLRLENDPNLRTLMKQPNFIRNIRREIAAFGENDIDLELHVGRQLDQPQLLAGLDDFIKLEPHAKDFYQSPYLWGNPGVQTGRATYTSIHEYALRHKASRYFVPNIVLPALSQVKKCKSFRYGMDQNLALQGCGENATSENVEIPDPMPVFYYDGSFQTKTLSDLENSDKLLIVNISDSRSKLRTLKNRKYSWGEIVATAVSNIHQNDFPKRSRSLFWFEVILFFFGMGLCFWAYRNLRTQGCVTTILIFLGSVLVLDLAASVAMNWRTMLVEETLSFAIAGVFAFAARAVVDYDERNLIEKAFSGYISKQRLTRLLSGQEKLNFEGRHLILSTMIIDIARFSQITKAMKPDEVFQFVKDFFSIVDPLIFSNGGTIDKKTGDGLMAFFGDNYDVPDPKQAAHEAVKAAVEIQKALAEVDPASLGLKEKLHLRIGVNTGEMIVGNAGSQKHFNYTVFGDPVNLTQRLEAACPPDRVMIGEATAMFISGSYELEETHIKIKHESEPMKAFVI